MSIWTRKEGACAEPRSNVNGGGFWWEWEGEV